MGARALAYGTCDAHKPYFTKPDARRAVKLHKRIHARGEECFKCLRGMVIQVFACNVAVKAWPHFHIGHAPSEFGRAALGDGGGGQG